MSEVIINQSNYLIITFDTQLHSMSESWHGYGNNYSNTEGTVNAVLTERRWEHSECLWVIFGWGGGWWWLSDIVENGILTNAKICYRSLQIFVLCGLGGMHSQGGIA